MIRVDRFRSASSGREAFLKHLSIIVCSRDVGGQSSENRFDSFNNLQLPADRATSRALAAGVPAGTRPAPV
jgi:hypothetical protein